MFLQIHYLTSYHASLLNRDDAGLAKRIQFGGVPRLRVSSQCLKRHWREWIASRTDLPGAYRSRTFFGRVIKKRLVESGIDEGLAHELVLHLAKGILTTAGEKQALDSDTLAMKQPALFGLPEADYLTRLLQESAERGDEKQAEEFLDKRIKEGRRNFKALLQASGIQDPMAGFEGALFGRFVTSDVLARVDAPVHVAHSFTTHALETEVDFFTVVDDLAEEEETGAAHAGDMELGAGIFYGYVAVDVPLLVSNVVGCAPQEWRDQDASAPWALLRALVNAIAQVSPGAKLGATAPYARAECVLLETGESQPRSLANAFLSPVRLDPEREHPMARSCKAMAEYLDALESMYGDTGERRSLSSLHPWARAAETAAPFPEAVERSLKDIFGDEP